MPADEESTKSNTCCAFSIMYSVSSSRIVVMKSKVDSCSVICEKLNAGKVELPLMDGWHSSEQALLKSVMYRDGTYLASVPLAGQMSSWISVRL